jgi:hypothetical protein
MTRDVTERPGGVKEQAFSLDAFLSTPSAAEDQTRSLRYQQHAFGGTLERESVAFVVV